MAQASEGPAGRYTPPVDGQYPPVPVGTWPRPYVSFSGSSNQLSDVNEPRVERLTDLSFGVSSMMSVRRSIF
jgi:hypothetical protein